MEAFVNDVKIEVLGASGPSKGKSFEKLVKTLLRKIGHKNIQCNIYTTGTEIDITANNVLTNFPIICQCKAEKKPIQTPALKQFFGDFSKEMETKENVIGVFLSTSGFNSTALRWHEELSKNQRDSLVLFDPDKILQILLDADLIATPYQIDRKTSRITTSKRIGTYLLCLDGELYWGQKLGKENAPNQYVLYSAHGDKLTETKLESISKLWKEVKSIQRIPYELREKVLFNFLKTETQGVDGLAKDLLEEKKVIEGSLESLMEDGWVVRSGNNFKLDQGISAFSNIYRLMGAEGKAVEFLKSEYFRGTPNGYATKILSERIGMDLKIHQLTIEKLTSISPNAMNYALFADIGKIRKTAEHMNELNLTGRDRERICNLIETRVLVELAKKVYISTTTFGKESEEPLSILKANGYDIIKNPFNRKLTQAESITLYKDINGL
ncbi:MAG: restriction endonuclease, partial [Nitrospinae bacterium]|nr:restriction endonuclease [Nitrospinota bacterium]